MLARICSCLCVSCRVVGDYMHDVQVTIAPVPLACGMMAGKM
jgi:hypothetical protein